MAPPGGGAGEELTRSFDDTLQGERNATANSPVTVPVVDGVAADSLVSPCSDLVTVIVQVPSAPVTHCGAERLAALSAVEKDTVAFGTAALPVVTVAVMVAVLPASTAVGPDRETVGPELCFTAAELVDDAPSAPGAPGVVLGAADDDAGVVDDAGAVAGRLASLGVADVAAGGAAGTLGVLAGGVTELGVLDGDTAGLSAATGDEAVAGDDGVVDDAGMVAAAAVSLGVAGGDAVAAGDVEGDGGALVPDGAVSTLDGSLEGVPAGLGDEAGADGVLGVESGAAGTSLDHTANRRPVDPERAGFAPLGAQLASPEMAAGGAAGAVLGARLTGG